MASSSKSNLNNNAVWRLNNATANKALASAAKKSSAINAVVTAAREQDNATSAKNNTPKNSSTNESYLKKASSSGKAAGTTTTASSSYTSKQETQQESAKKTMQTTTYSRLDPNSEKAKSIREQAGYTEEDDEEEKKTSLSQKQYSRDTGTDDEDTSKSPVKRTTASLAEGTSTEQQETISYQLNQLKSASENAGDKISETVKKRVEQDYVDKINDRAREQMEEAYGDEYDFSTYEAVTYDEAAGDWRINYTGSAIYDASTKSWSYEGGSLLRETDTAGTGYGTAANIPAAGAARQQLNNIGSTANQVRWAQENPQSAAGVGERLMNAASSIGGSFAAIIPQTFATIEQTANELTGNTVETDRNGNYLLTAEQAAAYERNKRLGLLTGNIERDTSYNAGEAARIYTQVSEDQERALDGMNGWQKFLAETGISIANSAVSMIPAVLAGGPAGSAAALGLMGLQVSAQTSYEKQEEGQSAAKALVSGLISGGIEVATEKIPLDNLFSQKSPLRKFWSQMATEAAEEGVSYVANAIADRLQGNDVDFTLDGLALNALGGALSGAVFGGVAAGLSKVSDMVTSSAEQAELSAIEDYTDQKLEQRLQTMSAQLGEDTVQDAAESILTRTEDAMIAAADTAQYSVSGGESVSNRVKQAVSESTAASSVYPALSTAGREAYSNLSVQERSNDTSVQQFATLYRAGLESAGTKYSAVQNAFTTTALNNPEAAYTAGQADAATLDTATAETREFVQAATDALGVTVQTETLPEGIYGYIQDDVLHIDETAPAVQTVAHELTHRMQSDAAEEYQAFREYVLEGMDADAVQQTVSRYAQHGITLTEDEARDEIAAEYAGRLVSDSKVIREYIRTNGTKNGRSLWQKIKTAFRKLIDRVTGKRKRELERQMNRAERLWTAALNKAAEKTQKTKTETREKQARAETKSTAEGGTSETARYSVETPEERIARLEKQLADAKAELKRTPTIRVQTGTTEDGTPITERRSVATKDHTAIAKIATELRRDYQSKYSKTELTEDIQALYDILQLNPETQGSTEVDELARGIAEDIVDSAEVLNDEMSRQYAELRDELRNTAVTLSETDRGDITDGWGAFRRSARGLVKFTNDGIPVDVKYEELSAANPELFPEDITHPADQAMAMVEVARELKPFYENVYGRYRDEAVADVAEDILNRFEETPLKETFADKQAEKLKQEREKGRERVQRAKETERERSDRRLEQERTRSDQRAERLTERLDKQKNKALEAQQKKADRAMERLEKRKDKEIDRLQERLKNQRERQKKLNEQKKQTQQKNQTIRKIYRLATEYTKPSREKYVPELYRKTVGELLNGLNLESRNESETTPNPTGTTMRWRQVLNMVKAVEAQKDVFRDEADVETVLDFDPQLVTLDPNLSENIERIVKLDKNINDYTEEEIQLLDDTISALNKSIEGYAKTGKSFKQQSITELGDKLIRQNKKDGLTREKTAAGRMMVDNLQSWDYLHRLGDVGDQIFDALHDGMDEKIRLTRKYQDMTQKALEGDSGSKKERARRAKAARKWMQDAPTEYKLDSGDTVKLTTAQLMSLYRYTKDEQAMKHLLRSGIKEGRTTAKKLTGKSRTEGTRAHELTEHDISTLVGKLTDEQKRVADDLHGVMNEMAKDGNRTTVQRFGYQMFTNEEYFPIKSYGAREVQTDAQKQGDLNRVNHLGMLKARQEYVSNAIELNSFFDLYYDHFDEMTQFIAFGEAMEDVNRIYNYKQRKFSEKDALEQLNRVVQNTTVRDAIQQRFGGKAGTAYFEKLLTDLNGGIDSQGNGTEIVNKMLRNFKASAVGANLSVVIQQPFSYIRAAAVYNPLSMMKGLPGAATGVAERGAFKRAVEHSPIAWWKQQGHYELDISRSMKEEMFGTGKVADAADSILFGAAGRADSMAWGALWRATEAEVRKERRRADKKAGTKRSKQEYNELFNSDEYWEDCNRKFRQMVARTQVVDSTLHRSGLMRSSDTMMKSLTSFMSEPTKSFNLLGTALWDVRQNPSAKNVATAARVAVAFTASALATTAAKSLVAAMRDDEEDKEERTLQQRVLEHWLGVTYDEDLGKETFNAAGFVIDSNLSGEANPLTMIPLVNEIWGLIAYDAENDTVSVDAWGHSYKTDSLFQPITKMMEAAEDFINALNNPGETDDSLFKITMNLIGRTADMAGVPLTALKRDALGVGNTILRTLNQNDALQTLIDKTGADIDLTKVDYSIKKLMKNFNEENQNDWIGMAYTYEQEGRADIAEEIYTKLMEAGVNADDIDARITDLMLKSSRYEAIVTSATEELEQAVTDRAGYSKLSAGARMRISGKDGLLDQIAEDTAKRTMGIETDTPGWMQQYYALAEKKPERAADLLAMYAEADLDGTKSATQDEAYLWLQASDYSTETGLNTKQKSTLWNYYNADWKTSYSEKKSDWREEHDATEAETWALLTGNGADIEAVTAESILASLDPDGVEEEATSESGSAAFEQAATSSGYSRSSGGSYTKSSGSSSGGSSGVAAASDWEGAAHINVGSSSQEVAAALSRSSEYASLGSKAQATAREYAAQVASGTGSSTFVQNAVNARSTYGVSTANYIALASKYGKNALSSARAASAGQSGVLSEYLDSYSKLKTYESEYGNNNGYFDMTETQGWLATQNLTTTQKAALFDAWFPKASYNPYR